MNVYRLYREPGLIIFNSFESGEKYWITYQAAAQGGRSMYDQIEKIEFDNVVNNMANIKDIYKALKPRGLDYEFEKKQEEIHGLLEAKAIHNLKQYVGQKVVNSEVEI